MTEAETDPFSKESQRRSQKESQSHQLPHAGYQVRKEPRKMEAAEQDYTGVIWLTPKWLLTDASK